MIPELRHVDAPLSPFVEARAWIDKWEKEYPDTERVYLVIDRPGDIVTTVTGSEIKASDAAGMFFAAVQLALE